MFAAAVVYYLPDFRKVMLAEAGNAKEEYRAAASLRHPEGLPNRVAVVDDLAVAVPAVAPVHRFHFAESGLLRCGAGDHHRVPRPGQ
jgi:hypothetical protein